MTWSRPPGCRRGACADLLLSHFTTRSASLASRRASGSAESGKDTVSQRHTAGVKDSSIYLCETR